MLIAFNNHDHTSVFCTSLVADVLGPFGIQATTQSGTVTWLYTRQCRTIEMDMCPAAYLGDDRCADDRRWPSKRQPSSVRPEMVAVTVAPATVAALPQAHASFSISMEQLA